MYDVIKNLPVIELPTATEAIGGKELEQFVNVPWPVICPFACKTIKTISIRISILIKINCDLWTSHLI